MEKVPGFGCHHSFPTTMGFAGADPCQPEQSGRFIFEQIKHLLLTAHISTQSGQRLQCPRGKRGRKTPRKAATELSRLLNVF